MLAKFKGMNVSSKDPKRLALAALKKKGLTT